MIVYSFDDSELHKQLVSQRLIEEALQSKFGVVSTQVIQEFLNAALGKFAGQISLAQADRFMHRVLWPLCQIYPTPRLFDAAVSIKSETGYHFYDSLVVSAAVESGCTTLYTEDLQHDRKIRGVAIRNPFAL